ncbi:MAG: integrase arm-type DNA-binding domain-containing protein [Polyangia bacterium]
MLTDTRIRSLKAKATTYRVFDSGGMYLEVSPRGGKWWRLKYRFAHVEKRLSLGTYPEVSLKEARERRDNERRLLGAGVDPGDNRKATRAARMGRAANSFEVVAREWFAKFSVGWAPNHSKHVIRLFERDIFPWIGAKPIGEITAPELLAMLQRIERREAVNMAHRARGSCGKVFRYAIATARAQRDPSADLRDALGPVKEGHFTAVTDPVRLGELMRVMSGYRGTPTVASAICLVPLLFVRPNELRTAEWASIQWDTEDWRFTTGKTKTPHIVPLASQALAILRELQPLTGNSRYVFPSELGDTRPMSENSLLAAMRSLGINKETTTIHGFRATARTLLEEVLGFPGHVIELQLAHTVPDTNGRAYNRTSFLPERRKMMQVWANYLDKLKADVTPIPLSARAASLTP